MIVRVFRADVPEASQASFEANFLAVSVPLVLEQRGARSVTIGRPTSWNPTQFVMISEWEDEASIAAFVGPAWNEPHIPPEMEGLIASCSVDHYEIIESG